MRFPAKCYYSVLTLTLAALAFATLAIAKVALGLLLATLALAALAFAALAVANGILRYFYPGLLLPMQLYLLLLCLGNSLCNTCRRQCYSG